MFKYIKYLGENNEIKTVMWNDFELSHYSMREALKHPANTQENDNKLKEVISGGLVKIDHEGKLVCYGNAVSIKAKADPDDIIEIYKTMDDIEDFLMKKMSRKKLDKSILEEKKQKKENKLEQLEQKSQDTTEKENDLKEDIESIQDQIIKIVNPQEKERE